ncbi:lysine transporter LysE [Streptomyces sp. NPDC046203]|uniref:lysine transporter LysE n=1 Tax=Streptomyces sp. NPDC046203 TaxID=3154602 RepID=UPI0033E83943
MSNLKVIARGIGDFLTETVGETLADLILQGLACALLAALAALTYLGWSFSPHLTLAGAGALGAFLAYGAVSAFRTPAKSRRYRWFAAAGAIAFTAVAGVAVFLLLYGTGCGCL